MQKHIFRETPIEETPRVLQIQGMFDIAPQKTSQAEWDVTLPINTAPWNIGLIVGPSGCGKTTIAKELWKDDQAGVCQAWSENLSILDAFPEDLPIKTIVEILSSVGFSSPPHWLKPFKILSNGQQFRATLARLIAEATHQPGRPIIFDEYSSVVDRTVAQIASAALSKAVRSHSLKFVAVTCHEDVEPWLNPDWVYRPAEQFFAWRLLRPRPEITLRIRRTSTKTWKLFAPHHYLSGAILKIATCFLATWNDRPVVFSSWIPLVGAGPPTRREHRTVTLPDFQGVGLGNAVSNTIASMWAALNFRATSTTTHPAMIASRKRSPFWLMTKSPSISAGKERKSQYSQLRHATSRMTASFRYIGPQMSKLKAKALLNS